MLAHRHAHRSYRHDRADRLTVPIFLLFFFSFLFSSRATNTRPWRVFIAPRVDAEEEEEEEEEEENTYSAHTHTARKNPAVTSAGFCRRVRSNQLSTTDSDTADHFLFSDRIDVVRSAISD